MKKLNQFFKLIFYNFFISLSILFSLEFFSRVGYISKRCLLDNDCSKANLYLLKKLNINPITNLTYLGLSKYDENLGYSPKEGFNKIIKNALWDNKKVTIDERGFRLNDNNISKKVNKILAVGDSATFGDQVSNNETWPACLEKITNIGVLNGGVFGYGTGQSLLRALNEIEEINNYEYLIVGSYIPDDFHRDRLSYSNGFPKPSLIKENGEIKWTKVSDKNKPGTKFNPRPNKFLKFIWQYSFVGSYIMSKNNYTNISGDMISQVHDKAVTLEESIGWSLSKLSKINIPNKFFLIQYSENDIDNLDVQERRKIIKDKSVGLNFTLIDSYDKVKSEPGNKVWIENGGHPTPKGNELVCEAVFNEVEKKL